MAPVVFAKIGNFFFATACTLPGSGKFQFFGFPHWWKYLQGEIDPLGKCTPVFNNLPYDILPVGLAMIDILLRLAGLAAVISIIIAGITYITAAGSTDKITASRKRIVNSILGLAVALVAAAVVSFIGNSIG